MNSIRNTNEHETHFIEMLNEMKITLLNISVSKCCI